MTWFVTVSASSVGREGREGGTGQREFKKEESEEGRADILRREISAVCLGVAGRSSAHM